jgi:mannose-6-phosphate isomerase-like protein (cupin superfamily)
MAEKSGNDKTGKKGMTIYRAADSQELMESGFMTWPTMSDDARESLTETLAAGSQAGQHVRLIALQTPEEGGFSLVHVWFKANYPLPRHSHDSDCMYYVISGEAHMGNQVLRAGDSFLVPADAPYVYTGGPDGV